MIRGDDLRATLVGFAGALSVLAVLVWLVGIGDTVDALSGASLPVVLGIVAIAICWLSAWGMSLHTVLGVLGAPITMPAAVLVFAGATFANNVTPFGQAGGEPVSALLISRATDREYETGLAAIASVDALNFVPSIALALVGLSYFASTITFGENLELAATAVVAFAIAVPIAVVLGWRERVDRGPFEPVAVAPPEHHRDRHRDREPHDGGRRVLEVLGERDRRREVA